MKTSTVPGVKSKRIPQTDYQITAKLRRGNVAGAPASAMQK
jgi:hypothetical protein